MPEMLSITQAEELSTKQIQKLYRQYINKNQVSLMTSFGFGRELVDYAEGAHLYLKDGRRVLDLTGGVGVLNHGHNHPRILAARQEFQRKQRMEVHKTYFSPYLAALAHNLAQVMPGDLNMSFLPNSGAEAVEGAVKLAYKYHKGSRKTVLRSDIAFHGKLLGSGGLTGGKQRHFEFPTISGIDTFEYNNLESVKRLIAEHPKDVYALLIEPLSASTMEHCSEEFLRGLREICTAEDIVLIFDEIYTGWGKTGSLFYFSRYPDLIPDVVTTSKSFGGGKSSISAFVAREPVFRAAYDNLGDAMMQSTSTTYYGFGEETATAIEAVNIAIEDDYPAKAREIEAVLRPGLERLRTAHPDAIAEVRGAGALWGVTLDGGPKLLDLVAKLAPGGMANDPMLRKKIITSAVIDALYRDHDVYAYYTLNGQSPLMIAPSLVTDPADLETFLKSFDATLSQGMTKLVTGFIKQKLGSLW